MRYVLQPFHHGTICYLQQTLYHTMYLISYFKLNSKNIVIYSTNQYFTRAFTRPAGNDLIGNKSHLP